MALALNGDRGGRHGDAGAVKRRRGPTRTWFRVEADPAFEALHGNPRFEALRREIRAHVVEQRRELDRMRAEGLVPDRTAVQ